MPVKFEGAVGTTGLVNSTTYYVAEVTNDSQISVDGQLQMFNIVAKNFNEIRFEQKQTEEKRCQKAIELAQGKTSVYWST
jgi:hypothetical protein